MDDVGAAGAASAAGGAASSHGGPVSSDGGPVSSDGVAVLEQSLIALSNLSTVRLTLEELLVQVASFAVRAVPGADGAGLTLREKGRSDVIVTTAHFVQDVDDIQYRLQEGPCVAAAETGLRMRSGSLGGDTRWPRFGPQAGRLGVHSVLSLPLVTPSGVLGAMNIYAFRKDAFDDRAEQLGSMFSAPAAVAVHNAQALAQTERLAEQLQHALATRPVIDQAIGIIRSRTGATAEEAFDRLRTMSQREHTKLAAAAAVVVEEAVRRARTRRGNGER